MTKSQAAMPIKLRHPFQTSSSSLLTLVLFLASVFLGACASRPTMPSGYYGNAGYPPSAGYQPESISGAPARFTSKGQKSEVISRQNVSMSDREAVSQPAGTTRGRQTASSETHIRNGKIKKQSSTTEEVIETDTTTVVDTFSVPTSDQDAR